MRISAVVLNEIKYNRLNFILGFAGVFLAMSVLVGVNLLVNGYKLKSRLIYEEKYAKVEAALKFAEDQYRKSTLELGFNVLIVPKDQNMSDFYADDFACKYMPEDFVEKLSKSKIVTINHLLPSLTQKIRWPEHERTIILTGTRGEIPLMHHNPMKPIQDVVPEGMAVIGFHLAKQIKAEKGSVITLFGRDFTVSEILTERGTRDDIGVWIDLKAAQ
ncbi:MAG TPA: hypothetical protein PK821_06355, partial [Victivallales bacterium]|nr:hypothetical protein [Victivallales bacterium]